MLSSFTVCVEWTLRTDHLVQGPRNLYGRGGKFVPLLKVGWTSIYFSSHFWWPDGPKMYQIAQICTYIFKNLPVVTPLDPQNWGGVKRPPQTPSSLDERPPPHFVGTSATAGSTHTIRSIITTGCRCLSGWDGWLHRTSTCCWARGTAVWLPPSTPIVAETLRFTDPWTQWVVFKAITVFEWKSVTVRLPLKHEFHVLCLWLVRLSTWRRHISYTIVKILKCLCIKFYFTKRQ